MNQQSIIKYEEQLTSYTKVGIAIIIIVLIVFVIFISVFLKNNGLKDKSVLICLALLLVIVPTVYITSILPYRIDIKQQTYEEYQGEFYIEDYYYATRSGTYILIKCNGEKDSVRYRAPSDLTGIEVNTTYTGEFIIAKHSKVLLDITIEG